MLELRVLAPFEIFEEFESLILERQDKQDVLELGELELGTLEKLKSLERDALEELDELK